MTTHCRVMLLISAICASLALSCPVAASPAPWPLLAPAGAKQLQAALDQARMKTGTPGASVAIAIDGKIVWLGQSGTTNLRTGSPVTAGTMFSLASVTKMFVAVMVVRLSEEGALRLDEPITNLMPSYVPDARHVTVSELLGHTSGYPDDENDPVVLRWLDNPNFLWTRDDIMKREPPPTFKPGSRFSYCNSCYVMLGSVIEKASGAPVGTEFERFITDPLRLQSEADFDRLPEFAPRIARGYDLQHGKLVDTFDGAHVLGIPTSVWGPVWTDGGIVATAQGVARFTDALFGGHIVSAKSLREMLDPPHPHEGILESWRYDRHAWRGHSGFYYGFTTESWYDPSRRLTITVLANRTDNDDPATTIWNRLTSAYDRIH
jgi:D-alanyl-D-alanine carboxypeptidase